MVGRSLCPRMLLFLSIIFGASILSLARGGDNEAKSFQEYRHDFRGQPEKPPEFELFGHEAAKYVRFEPEGLRITLPAGYPVHGPGTGALTMFGVKGDFEATIRFEILNEPDPADAVKQTRLSLVATLQRDPGRNMATVSRMVAENGGRRLVSWLTLWDETARKAQPRVESVATQMTKGRLRLVRTGSELSYFAAQDEEDFILLNRFPFSDEDVHDIRIAASTGGPQQAIDVRIAELHIRGESLPNAPATAPLQKGGKGWFGAALLVSLAVVFAAAAGVWFIWRRAQVKRFPGASAATSGS